MFSALILALGIAIGSAVTAIVYTMRNPAMMRRADACFDRLERVVRENAK